MRKQTWKTVSPTQPRHSTWVLRKWIDTILPYIHQFCFYQPAMLCIFFWTLLIRIVSNHRCEKVRVLKLEVEGCVTQCDNLGKLLTWRTVSVTETSKVDTVDPFTLRIYIRYQQLHYPFFLPFHHYKDTAVFSSWWHHLVLCSFGWSWLFCWDPRVIPDN